MTVAAASGGMRWSWRRRAPLVVLSAGAITLVELRVAVTIDHARQSVYQLPAAAVVTVVAAGVAAGAAAIGLALLPRPRGALMVAVVASLTLAGLATVLSIGLILLPAAIAAGFLLVPALRGAGRREWGLALLCGIPLGGGIVTVALVSVQPPLVHCSPGTVTESDRAWWGGGSGESAGTDWVSTGRAGGRITANGHTYRYTCRGSTLVSFSPG